jgi:hypothetical protein
LIVTGDANKLSNRIKFDMIKLCKHISKCSKATASRDLADLEIKQTK